MKIAYVTPYAGEETIVQSLLGAHEVVFIAHPLVDQVPPDVADAEVLSVFVDSKVTAAMIDAMPNLRCIALRSTGFDHVDVAHAQAKGITVSYVPHYGSQTVAEYSFGLLLALSRQVFQAYDLLRTTGNVDVKRFEGFDLCGKTIGVIGTGAIGRRVCRIAHGFDMRVLAFDKFPTDECLAEYVSFEQLLAESDIVTLHIPSAPENKYLIREETLALCKTGAIIINTARGDLIDTVALVKALKHGQIGGAGLDVFEGEQYIKDEMQLLMKREMIPEEVWSAFVAEHELMDMEQVIITPHLAFNSVEAKREITETTAANITAAASGAPQNVVKLRI